MRFILMLMLGGWISLWTYYYVYWHQGHAGGDGVAIDPTLKSATVSELIIQGEDLDIASEENIRFERSQAVPLIPPSAEPTLDQLKTYLHDHEDEGLLITAFFDETEDNQTLLSNLGVARAEAFKTWLSDFGIKSEQLFVEAHENINLTFLRDTLTDGLSFEVIDDFPETDEMEEEEISALAEKLRNNSQNLYFATGETSIEVSDSLRQYLSEIRLYLSQDADATISLIGHTDNVGDAGKNMEYGKERAESVREILRAAGIDRTKMIVDSKGESQPIASNDTAEGRSQNRRVEIKLN